MILDIWCVFLILDILVGYGSKYLDSCSSCMGCIFIILSLFKDVVYSGYIMGWRYYRSLFK